MNLVFAECRVVSFQCISWADASIGKFLIIFNRFKQIFRDAAHIEITAPTLIDCSPTVAKLVAVVSGKDEFIQNGQSDEMDQLFQVNRQDEILGLSSNLPENALTIFSFRSQSCLVTEMVTMTFSAFPEEFLGQQ